MTKPTPGQTRVRLSPFMGFRDSAPRDRVRLDEMTGASRNWLVTAGRLRRRPGSTIFGDTLTAGHETAGILETAIGFLARRLYGALLASMLDLFPCAVVLFTEEATSGAGTIAYYSTNTDAWRVLGDGFDGTTYPASGVIAHRVVPMVYENQYGGLTLHRLNTATDRQYACAGSRSLLESERSLCWGGFNSTAMRAEFDEDDNLTVLPLGLIPPLPMPTCSAGTNLGTTPGPFKGSEAWFYSLIYEDENGELSMFPIPRPPGSAWAGYDGFGYFQVDSANPTEFYDSCVYSGIADGPPGTRWKHLVRSGKVDVATTGAGAVVAPSVADLQILARIPQGVTTYTDSDGNDLALDPDPRITEMFRRGGLQWAPSARHIGRFDGHTTLAGLKPLKYALIVMPWESGAINAPIDDASLYVTVYAVAVTPTHLLLRKVGATTVNKTGQQIVTGTDIVGLPDLRNVEVGKGITNANIPGGTTILSIAHLVDTGCATTDGSVTVTVTASASNRIGQLVEGPGIPRGAVVVTKPTGASITISLPATVTDAVCTLRFTQAQLSANATGSATGQTLVITADAVDTAVPLEGDTLQAIVDRVNADASVTNTVFATATWSGGNNIINCGAVPTGVYVGDRVFSAAHPSGTVVAAIPSFLGGNTILVSHAASRTNTGAGEAVTFQHRAAGTDIRYAAGVVPGSDRDEQADQLLRTLVSELCTFGNADTTLQLDDITNAEYITPGMHVAGTNIPATAIVTDVDEATGIVTISPQTTGIGTGAVVEFYYDTGDSTSATNNGYLRMFGNALPVPLPWRKSYLDQFKPSLGAMIFTGASPGYAQDGVNTWLVRNRRGAPATFGPLMGMADLGPLEVHFHARARMRLANPRTGETHNDTDYTKTVASWTLGARSPYAICSGPGFAIAVCESGFYATAGGMGDERFFSDAIFDLGRLPGQRGSLEYAIAASVAASESDSDDYKIFASLEGMVLYVRYWSSASAGRPDQEVRYDFSEGKGRQGMAMLFRPDGSPFPWSAPCTVAPSCSATIATAAGVVRFGALDTNAGTADGRVDTLDTGTEDNGTPILPIAYSGTHVPEGNDKFQPMNFGVVARKAGAGIVVGVARNSRPDHDEMEWDDVEVPTSSGYEFDRRILPLAAAGRAVRDALTLRIADDGTNECPEISRLTLYGDGADILRSQDEKGGL